MVKMICNVCNVREAVGVASSPLAAYSQAYCRTCLFIGAEPEWLIEATIECCGGVKHRRGHEQVSKY